MELVIGGAFQGKLTWVCRRYCLQAGDLFDCSQGFPTEKARCYYHLEALSWLCVQQGWQVENRLCEVRSLFQHAILICRDIGAGVVPLDPRERAWREQNGRMLQLLAGASEHVTRIFCGLPETLK